MVSNKVASTEERNTPNRDNVNKVGGLIAKRFCHVRKGFAIIFLGLVSEAEECEENEGANRRNPAGKIHRDDKEMVTPPKECRDLFDTRVIKVGIFPTSPWAYRRGGCVEPDREDGEWSCE